MLLVEVSDVAVYIPQTFGFRVVSPSSHFRGCELKTGTRFNV